MIYLEPKSTTPITVVSGIDGETWIAARIEPNHSVHRIKSKALPPAKTPEDAFRQLADYADRKTIIGIDLEICANGVSYRLQGDEYQPGRSFIKHFAPSDKKGTSGQPVGSSWQKYTDYDMTDGWLSLVLEWTRLFLEYRSELDSKADDAAENPEIVPPSDAIAKIPKMGNLGMAASVINAEYEAWKRADEDANVAMIRVGLLLEAVAAVMPHGELGSWMEQNCRVSKSHAYRFRGVALAFVAKRKLLLNDAVYMSRADAETGAAEAFESAAKKFIAGRNQSDLFDACRPARPALGGDHGGGAAMHEKAAHRNQLEEQNAHDQWRLIIEHFREFALQKKRYIHLPPAQLKAGLESIRECLRALPKEGE